MNIRKANLKDSEKFLDMLKQLDKEIKYMLFEPGERTATVEKIKDRINIDIFKQLTLIIDDGERIGGFLSAERGYTKRIRHSAYVVIGLLKDYREQKLGTKLFEEMEKWALENNITRLELTVVESNEVGIKLYEKMGFKKEGLKERSMIVDGKYVNEYYMGKVL
ncbi:GNAT family N-acetyltransferase [Clostridium uliginosum]|uniref:Acetyltransferase (GNAT) family protein n=1 Tax=Clostridium uliginosum TaxID=119641 RepID=A0A1I1NVW6_9CLOT|nr:GNAT family N-acetyltransferase [Clostridium uliginosum]SFD01697.1 Acetyltransferase (GNAT) family protein [Clostridium uliginosum]